MCTPTKRRRGWLASRRSRAHLVCVARHLRLPVHVVLRVVPEVFAVVLGRHLLERQPAVVRLALVPDQHHVARFERVEQRLDAGVVDHHQPSLRVALRHADVLPHLDAHRAILQRRIQPVQGRRDPGRLQQVVGAEAGDPAHGGRMLVVQLAGHALLLLQRREHRIVDVDRQRAEIGLARQFQERALLQAVQVQVGVDLGHALVILHGVAVGGQRADRRCQRGKEDGAKKADAHVVLLSIVYWA